MIEKGELTYFIESDVETIKITAEQIKKSIKRPQFVKGNPALFLDFIYDFKEHGILKNNKNSRYLYNGYLFSKLGIEGRKLLLENYNKDDELFNRILQDSQLLEASDNTSEEILKDGNFQKFIDFVNEIKKNNIKDRFLFKRHLIFNIDLDLMKQFLKVYDANLKRVLKESEIGDNQSATQNYEDLLSLLYITGGLHEDPIIRQRATTFIVEKIFSKDIPEPSKYRIVNDDIHRVFNFHYFRDEFDLEFANFFLENYREIINEERSNSGFIIRAYNNFREISKTSTSNKGQQRKLKVTMEKVKNFLLNVKFEGVNNKNRDLAEIIGKWFDSNDTWKSALEVFKESKKAPRNIFTPYITKGKSKKQLDDNPELDLREPISENYSYEWLPKQSYDNLVLGKYCSCCAHINGAGQGIMRASIILDCCQNLVIRNEIGNIIAKSTIYVNRQKGYAVFNNVEVNLEYKQPEDHEKIYQAFMRGAYAFYLKYNESNPTKPITIMTIGASRNQILYNFIKYKHPNTEIYTGLAFSDYRIPYSTYGRYNGDWQVQQRLVLDKTYEVNHER